jgi:hypothetical protein
MKRFGPFTISALLSLLGCGPAAVPSHFERTVHLTRFVKGNTHSHTNRSGDAEGEPADVARWFKSNGWSFVVITDHNKHGPPNDLAEVEDATFIVMEGQEYTYKTERPGAEALHPHVNGIGTKTAVKCGPMSPAWQAVQHAVDAITAQGGLAQINHPNHKWSLTYEDIAKVRGATLLEVVNQHPGTHNGGDDTHESVEEMWDKALTAGQRLWGVACDDNHELPGAEPPGRYDAIPGRGWVQVAAKALTDADVLAALAAGDFYFSTGLEYERIDVEGRTISVALKNAPDDTKIEFIGSGGRVLAKARGGSASYTVRGGEGYVRVKARSDHDTARTQPYFVVAD